MTSEQKERRARKEKPEDEQSSAFEALRDALHADLLSRDRDHDRRGYQYGIATTESNQDVKSSITEATKLQAQLYFSSHPGDDDISGDQGLHAELECLLDGIQEFSIVKLGQFQDEIQFRMELRALVDNCLIHLDVPPPLGSCYNLILMRKSVPRRPHKIQ